MADDHFPDVVLVKEALRATGVDFQMDVCGDGESALDHIIQSELHQRRPDLIILDLNLSPTSGLDVLKEIRGRALFDRTPVAMLTSSLSSTIQAQALRLKADAFISKPTHLDEFLSRVGMALKDLLNRNSTEQKDRTEGL